MKRIVNNRGLTLVEIIMTLALLGALICPLMNLLVISQKINSEGEKEFMVFQTAQYYMEETRSIDEIDTGFFYITGRKGIMLGAFPVSWIIATLK